MNPLLAFGGIVLVAALAWKLFQLWRAPYDRSLRVVTLCLLFAGLAYPMQLRLDPVEDAIDGLLGPGMARLIQNLLMLVAFYLIMLFFLFSAGHSTRRARWELLPLVATMLAMTIAMLSTPVQLRDHEFASADLTSVPVTLFYLFGKLYFGYSLGFSSLWAWQYAGQARPVDGHLAAGLRMASVGLGLNVLVLVAQTAATGIRWAGGSMPPGYGASARYVLSIGILLWLVGVSYPGVRTRIASVRRWLRHRRRHEQLRPLWTVLHDAYPDDALHRVPTGPWRDLFALRQVHRRYYRRVIECRDGLVRISPYLAHTGATDRHQPDEQARALREALDMQARGVAAGESPVRVAAPANPGLDADVDELVQLSLALRGNRTSA